MALPVLLLGCKRLKMKWWNRKQILAVFLFFPLRISQSGLKHYLSSSNIMALCHAKGQSQRVIHVGSLIKVFFFFLISALQICWLCAGAVEVSLSLEFELFNIIQTQNFAKMIPSDWRVSRFPPKIITKSPTQTYIMLSLVGSSTATFWDHNISMKTFFNKSLITV